MQSVIDGNRVLTWLGLSPNLVKQLTLQFVSPEK